MDMIAAISTGTNPTAIGIVRVSGEGCFALCDKVFHPSNGQMFSTQPSRKMIYGEMLDAEGRVIDRGLAVRFPAPHSYTGEDSAEFHCHGSPVVLRELLSALFATGARQARAGEFTQRAFLNGQLDLTQAEAVIDLIDAETAEAARNAAAQLDGGLRRMLEPIQDTLLEITSRFYAVVDYPDEDIADLEKGESLDTLRRSRVRLEELLASFSRGQLVKNGVPTVLLGKPNVGKSSLLNALLGYERAIVTDIAGTTRDTVEEKLPLGRVLLRLTDTAGLRDSDDTVEMLGVERSRAAAAKASLALLVLDGSAPMDEEDEEAAALSESARHTVAVVNKSDLPCCLVLDKLRRRFDMVVPISAKEGSGIKGLCEILEGLYSDAPAAAGEMLTNARQAAAVERALRAVEAAEESLLQDMTPDVVLTEAEQAMEALNELTGKHVRDDLVEAIFSRFCVGK